MLEKEGGLVEVKVALYDEDIGYFSAYRLMTYLPEVRWVLDYEKPDWVIFSALRRFRHVMRRYGEQSVRKLFISGENCFRLEVARGESGESPMLSILSRLGWVGGIRWLVRHGGFLPHVVWYPPWRRGSKYVEVSRYVGHLPKADLAIVSNRGSGERCFSMPYVLSVKHLLEKRSGGWRNESRLTREEALGRKFCCIVASNISSLPRLILFDLLSRYKGVDFMGRSVLSNTEVSLPRRWMDLSRVYRRYKFVLVVENSEAEDYITEKLLLALSADTVPIYFGAPNVGDYFNEAGFVDYGVCGRSWRRVVDEVVSLDEHSDAYVKKLSQPKQTEQQQQREQKKWKDYAVFLREGFGLAGSV